MAEKIGNQKDFNNTQDFGNFHQKYSTKTNLSQRTEDSITGLLSWEGSPARQRGGDEDAQ